MTIEHADPRDANGGWVYMDELLDEFSAIQSSLTCEDSAWMRIESALKSQRRRILYLEQEAVR